MEPSEPQRPSRTQVLLWWGILTCLVGLSVRDYDSFQIGVYRDDATYLVLARSLLEADSYGLMNEPGTPAPTRYPFGYPLLLAPVARLFPPHADAVRLLSLFATLANASILFWGWRSFSRTASYGWSLAVVALHATSPLVIEHTRMVMSEPAFLTSCLLTTILAERAARGRQGRLWPLWMGVVLTLTVFVRTVGFVFAFSALAWIAWKRGRGCARPLALAVVISVALTAACVAATSLEIRSLLPVGYLSYAAPDETGTLPSLAERAVTGAREYAGRHVPELLFQRRPGGGVALAILGVLVLAAILVGIASWWRIEGPSLFLLSGLAYGGVLLAWPFRGTRFLYAIQPWIVLMLLHGVGLFAHRKLRSARPGGRPLPWSVAAMTLVLATTALIGSVSIPDTRARAGDRSSATAWLRANAATTAVVVSENPQTDFLYGARKTVAVPGELTDASLAAYLRERRATHVLISPDLRWQESFRPVWSERGACLAGILDRMALAGDARVEHDEPASGVRVYAVGRDPGTAQANP